MTRRIMSVLIGLAVWLPGTSVAAELTHRLVATDDEPCPSAVG